MKKQNRKLKNFPVKLPRGEAFAFAPVVRGQNKLEVRAAAGDEDAELVLIGAIGKSWFDDSGITEQEVRDAIKTIPNGKKINVRLNSEGGSVKEGLGIYNAFKERSADITCYITGYALSIASVFPLGAGKVVSPKSAIWMMHKAWSVSQGNADDMRQTADMLDAHDETLIDIYASETGKSKADIRAAMENETWIKGADAVAFGLADESDPEPDDAAAAYRPLTADFISRCKNISPEILAAVNRDTTNRPTHKPVTTAAAPSPISAAPQGAVKPQTKQPDPASAGKPQDNIMNKKVLAALLQEHGIKTHAGADFTDTSSDADFEAGFNALAKKPGIPADSRFQAIEAKLELAETRRITDKVLTYVAAGKITNDEADIYISAAKNDETKTFGILDKKEAAIEGGSPLSWSGISILDGPTEPGVREGLTGLRGPQSEMLVNIRKEHKTPQARHAALKSVYDTALKQAMQKDMKAGREVMAANTYSSTLVTSFLIDGSITDLTNVWAMLNAFSLSKDVDPYKPLAVGQLKHVTVSEAAQTNPTNFEPSGGSTVAPITVTTAWINQPMRVGPTDLNNGLRMEDLRTKAIASFADAVTSAAITPITAANFTATPLIRASGAFNLSDLATLQGQLQKSPIKNLILDGNYLARVANQAGFFQKTGQGLNDSGGYSAYGWDGIYLASNWASAGANIKGFACNPQALVRATGLPLNPPNIPGGAFQTSTFEVPGCGVACAVSTWFSLATRTMFCSFDIIAGFAAADLTSGVVVAAGTPT